MTSFALVTGTSRGIGLAAARTLIARDWSVLGLARGPAPDGMGPKYEHARIDLGDLEGLEAWARRDLVPRLAGAARIALVNNAALLPPVGPATDLDLTQLERHLRVNLTVPVWLGGFVLGHAPAGAAVRVINLSSGAASAAYPSWSAYCAAKAGLHLAGEVLAAEPEAFGQERDLAVVSYAPGVVATEMQVQLRGLEETRFPMRERFVAMHEEGQLAPPEGPGDEIADLCERDDLPPHSTLRYQPPG